jgi:NAD(P)H dehydrogenase (quinone)
MLRSFLQGSLGYVGMDVLEPYVAYHVPYITDEQRKVILQDWIEVLATLDQRTTMVMPNLDHFDETFAPRSN